MPFEEQKTEEAQAQVNPMLQKRIQRAQADVEEGQEVKALYVYTLWWDRDIRKTERRE